jgi:hypothetical protein
MLPCTQGSSRVVGSDDMELESGSAEDFNITVCDGDDTTLPIAHTCSKQIEMPRYKLY